MLLFLFRELYEMVNRMANVLKSHGVNKGDVVCIYMPVSPLAVAAMLACARIGAPHRSVYFMPMESLEYFLDFWTLYLGIRNNVYVSG